MKFFAANLMKLLALYAEFSNANPAMISPPGVPPAKPTAEITDVFNMKKDNQNPYGLPDAVLNINFPPECTESPTNGTGDEKKCHEWVEKAIVSGEVPEVAWNQTLLEEIWVPTVDLNALRRPPRENCHQDHVCCIASFFGLLPMLFCCIAWKARHGCSVI